MSTTDDTRGQVIAGLRALLDLVEQHPELPIRNNIGAAVYGTDEEAGPELDRYAALLTDAGIPNTDVTNDERRVIQVSVGAAAYRVYHYLDADSERMHAQMSYYDNVQVKPDEAVA